MPEKDFMERIPTALEGVITIEKAREMLSSELAVLYYLQRGAKPPESIRSFSYHKFGGMISVYFVFIGLLLIEGVGTTILLHKLSATFLEKVLLVLSVYSIIFLIAHIRAMKLRPITIGNDELVIRYGLLTTISVSFADIQKVEVHKRMYTKSKDAIKLALLSSLEQHNFKITLAEPKAFRLLFKQKAGINHIYFRVDDQEEFMNVLGSYSILVS